MVLITVGVVDSMKNKIVIGLVIFVSLFIVGISDAKADDVQSFGYCVFGTGKYSIKVSSEAGNGIKYTYVGDDDSKNYVIDSNIKRKQFFDQNGKFVCMDQIEYNEFGWPLSKKITLTIIATDYTKGYNILTKTEGPKYYDSSTKEGGFEYDGTVGMDISDEPDCSLLKNTRTGGYIDSILVLMQVAAPVLVIVFTILDFMKALVSQNQDAVKKAGLNVGKRIPIAALVFVVSTVLRILLEFAGIQTCL